MDSIGTNPHPISIIPPGPRSTPLDRRVREGVDRARAIIVSPALLRAIEELARERGLTAKQIELVAYSTTPLERAELVEKLGVSTNTVKTRVRHLLRALEEKSLDSLGKTVLRKALDSLSA